MKPYLVILSIFLFFISCDSNKNSVKKIEPQKITSNDTITISMKNLKFRKTLYLRYDNDMDNEQHYPYDKNAGKAIQKIATKDPVIFNDDDAFGGGAMYILMGGDNIIISEDAAGKPLKFTTNNTTRNNELNFFGELKNNQQRFNYYRMAAKINIGDPSNMVFKEMLIFYKSTDYKFAQKYADTKYNDQLAFLNEYVKTHPVSVSMRKIFENVIYFDYAGSKFKTVVKQLTQNPKPDTAILNDVALFKQRINQGNNQFIPDFRGALKNYVIYLNALNKQKNTSVYDLIKQNFSGPAKDYLLFYTVNKSVNAQNYTADLLMDFYKDCSNTAYIAEIKRNASMTAAGKQSALIDGNDKKTTFENLVSQNKGKVIYIDFWASWCVPCMEQMPYSASLHKEVKNYPVRFLYLSMDNSYSSWQASSRQLKNNRADNFLVANNFHSILAASFNLATIPRYIIINKAGKVASANGYSPSDKLTKPFLLKLSAE